MKKIKHILLVTLTAATALISCKPKPQPPQATCLPPFIHTGYSDSLAAVEHRISLAQSKELVKHFAQNKQAIIAGAFRDSGLIIDRYVSFNRDAIYKILQQDSNVGFRIYPALTKNNRLTYVLTAVAPNGKTKHIFRDGVSGDVCDLDISQPPSDTTPVRHLEFFAD